MDELRTPSDASSRNNIELSQAFADIEVSNSERENEKCNEFC